MKMPEYTSNLVVESNCPYCDKKLDGAYGPGEGPTEGSLSICIGCRNVSVFGEGLVLRKPTKTEMFEEIAGNPEILDIMAQFSQMDEMKSLLNKEESEDEEVCLFGGTD